MGNTHDTEIARLEADYIHTKWRTTDDYRWSYSSDRGPETWWLHYPSASGGQQSPIDIVAEEVTFDPELCAHPLHLVYSPARPSSAVESGGLGRHGDEDGYYDDDDDGANDVIGETSSPSLYNMASVSHGLGGAGLSSLGASGGGPTGRSRESLTVVNTGNSIRIDVANSRSYVTGGPCREYAYVLEYICLHWGEDDNCGSEHLVDSQSYGAEVQLVHWNEDLYDSYEEAEKREDGIVIVAVFIKVTDDCRSNKLLAAIADKLDDVTYRGQTTSLPKHLTADALFPDDTTRYWTYKGSFTTPPCYETVTWVIFHDPITISSHRLAKLRELRSYGDTEHYDIGDDFDGRICRNYRPQQPLGTRKVYTVENHGHDTFIDSIQTSGSAYSATDERPFRQISKFARSSGFGDGGGPGGVGGLGGMRGHASRRA